MNDLELTADKIEQVIGEGYRYAGNIEMQLNDYRLLYNSDLDKSWYIIFYVEDKQKLRTYLSKGHFYYLHQYLQELIKTISDNLSVIIRLDYDIPPTLESQEEGDELLKKYLYKYDQEKDEMGKQTICTHCGHPWAQHQLRGFPAAGEKVPHEGWMFCPHEDCTCSLTWGIPGK